TCAIDAGEAVGRRVVGLDAGLVPAEGIGQGVAHRGGIGARLVDVDARDRDRAAVARLVVEGEGVALAGAFRREGEAGRVAGSRVDAGETIRRRVMRIDAGVVPAEGIGE